MRYVLQLINDRPLFMSNRNKIVLGIALVLIFFAITGAWYYFKSTSKTAERVEEKIIYGKLVEATEQSVKVKVLIPPKEEGNLRGQISEQEVSYNINGRTKFFRNSQQAKATDEYHRELAEFYQRIEALKAAGKNIVGLEPPTFFTVQEIDRQELKTGEQVNLYIDRDKASDPLVYLTKVVADNSGDANAEEPKIPAFLEKLAGKIKTISGDNLSLLVQPADPLFASTSAPTLRELILDQNVKLYRQQIKKPEQYSLEQKEFNNRLGQLIKEGKPVAGIEPPSPDSKKPITSTDLKPGQNILAILEIDGQLVKVQEIVVLLK